MVAAARFAELPAAGDAPASANAETTAVEARTARESATNGSAANKMPATANKASPTPIACSGRSPSGADRHGPPPPRGGRRSTPRHLPRGDPGRATTLGTAGLKTLTPSFDPPVGHRSILTATPQHDELAGLWWPSWFVTVRPR